MELLPIENLKKQMRLADAAGDYIYLAPPRMSANNYFCSFNTLRSYSCEDYNFEISLKDINKYFEPFESINYLEFIKNHDKFIAYSQVYKRKDLDYYVFIDIDLNNDWDEEKIYKEGIYRIISIYYDNTNLDLCNKIVEDLNKIVKNKKDNSSNIFIVLKTMGGYNFKKYKIKPLDIDVNKMYNDSFLPVNEHIIESLKSDSKGVVLLHGLAGTGKTNYIRHLTTLIPDKKFVFIPVNMIQHLTDPAFLSVLIDNKGAILVLEDSEVYLKDRDSSGENSVVSTILNLSDGILSDVLGIQIICTFNADLGKVDEALLREGRLIAEYEFEKLSLDKCKLIGKELGLEVNKEMTLAEIYNLKNATHRKQLKQKTIGFGR